MKRLASAMLLARLPGSVWCISEELPRSEILRPWAAMAFLVAVIWSEANSGRVGKSRSARMQRSSTAENPFAAAKSRICAKGHLGQPRVEKARGGLEGAACTRTKGGVREATVTAVRNARRVVCMLASLRGEFSTEGVAGRKHLYGGVIDGRKGRVLLSVGRARGRGSGGFAARGRATQ